MGHEWRFIVHENRWFCTNCRAKVEQPGPDYRVYVRTYPTEDLRLDCDEMQVQHVMES